MSVFMEIGRTEKIADTALPTPAKGKTQNAEE
jgi:hypothetical protein